MVDYILVTFIADPQMAVMEHMERKVDAGKLKTRALRDGMQFLM